MAHSQKTIINDSLNLKKGIYKTFDEFRYNSPSIPLEFEVINLDKGYTYNLKIDKDKTKYFGVVWGFCDGKDIFINMDVDMSRKKVFNPDSYFSRLLYVGRYCFFLTYPARSSNIFFSQYYPFAIDFNSGKELCLNCEPNFWFIKESQFKKIVSRDPELWQEYKNDHSREDLFYKYIKLYSEKYSDEIIY
jgi:hypothetical protein